jgi:galactokinase
MKTDELIVYIEDGKMDERLTDIYLDKEKLSYQRSRYIDAVKKYKELFGSSDEYSDDVCIISAPGRTEVCGNHTDHQHGQVLAASINDDAIAIVGITDSPLDMVNIKSEGYDMISFSINDIDKKASEEGTTAALIKGVLAGSKERGYGIGSFNAYITSDVLGGSGLSSSAAFETLIGNIVSALYNNMQIDAVTIAIIGQYAENYYFGKPCGLMDQMASSVGSLVNIDFYDVNEPVINPVRVDFEKFGHSLCIVDTKGDHADLTDDYAAIPIEMKKVAGFFGKEYLKEIPFDEFLDKIPQIRPVSGDRAVLRAIHFFEDDMRVTDEVNALKNGDFEEFKKLITESGNSSYKYLQNVYSIKDYDNQNISLALVLTERYFGSRAGYRVHGGGFAGTIQAVVPDDLLESFRSTVEGCFGEGSCHVLSVRPFGGTEVKI